MLSLLIDDPRKFQETTGLVVPILDPTRLILSPIQTNVSNPALTIISIPGIRVTVSYALQLLKSNTFK